MANVCRGLIAFAIMVVILMANATSSNARPLPTTVIMNTEKGVPPVIRSISRFDVLRNFKKGDTHSRITDLKKFLASFGYLTRAGQDEMPPTSLFDDSLEAAVSLYQTNFNLSVTGILDRHTLYSLGLPRCGREDVRDGLALMLLPKPKSRLWSENGNRLSTELEGQHWKLIGRRKLWLSTRNLTYAFSNFAETAILSRDDIRAAVASAFQSWAAVVPIDFQETVDFESANIKIEFNAGDHGDGRLGHVAHAFPLEDGRFDLDSAEVWTVSMAITDDRSALDLETVALHEIGHLIGLDHSNVYSSAMFPILKTRKVKRRLTADDIDGATALYGSRTWRARDYDIPHHAGHHGWSHSHEDLKNDEGGHHPHINAVIWIRTAFAFVVLCSLMMVCQIMKCLLWNESRR